MYNYYREIDALKSGDAEKVLPVGASSTRASYADTKGFLLNDAWKSYRDNRRDAER